MPIGPQITCQDQWKIKKFKVYKKILEWARMRRTLCLVVTQADRSPANGALSLYGQIQSLPKSLFFLSLTQGSGIQLWFSWSGLFQKSREQALDLTKARVLACVSFKYDVSTTELEEKGRARWFLGPWTLSFWLWEEGRVGPSEGVIVRVFGRPSASVTRRLGDLCASQGGPWTCFQPEINHCHFADRHRHIWRLLLLH